MIEQDVVAWVILCFIIAAIGFAIVWTRIIFVSAGSVVVTRGWNDQISRVLKEGYHMFRLGEYAAHFNWSFMDQYYKSHVWTGFMIPVKDRIQQIDMVPFECETGNFTACSIDVILVFRVKDPQLAMSVSHNPLHMLCQQVIRCIRKEITKYQRNALNRFEEEVTSAARATIAKEWTPIYGLEIVKCVIQNISYDEDTIRRRRQFRDALSGTATENESIKNGRGAF